MAKVSIKSEKITAFGGIFFVLDKFDRILSVAVVAVLQFQNRFYDSQKLTLYYSIFIYKYRSIFRVWEKPFENCNTATRNKFACLCPEKNKKNVSSRFVDRNEKIVPLQRQ